MKNKENEFGKKDPFENIGQSHIELKISRLRNLTNDILIDLDWLETALKRKSLNVSDSYDKKIFHYLASWRDHAEVKKLGLLGYAKSFPNTVSGMWVKEIKRRYNIKVCSYDIIQVLENKENEENKNG